MDLERPFQAKTKLDCQEVEENGFKKILNRIKHITIGRILKVLIPAGIVIFGELMYLKYAITKLFIEDYLEYTEQVESPLTEEEKNTLVAQLEYIAEELTPFVVKILRNSDESNKKQLPKNQKIEIIGFEKIGISDGQLRLLLEVYYPRYTSEGNLAKLEWIETPPRGYEDRLYYGQAFDSDDRIVMYISPKVTDKSPENHYNTIYIFLKVLSHELGHINDWQYNNRLNPQERAEFLYEVTEAFNKSDDRFSHGHGYLEYTRHDSFTTKYSKVQEWWAVVCEFYFMNPIFFKKKAPECYFMVDKWLRRFDRQYDMAKSGSIGSKLLREMFNRDKK